MTRLAARATGASLTLALGLSHGVAPPARRLEVTIEVMPNSTQGAAAARCEAKAVVPQNTLSAWWVSFGEAQAGSGTGWEPAGRGARCGAGPFEKQEPVLEQAATPYLIVGISTLAKRLPESLLSLEVELAGRKLSGFAGRGDPIYEPSVEKRRFLCSESCEVFVPIVVADSQEKEAFGIHELFLRIVARRADAPATAYGRIWVTSELEGSQVLLDGGVVDTISLGKAYLSNSLPGRREVRVRDSSGREARKMVRVVADRTVLAELNPAVPEKDAAPYRLVPIGKSTRGYMEYRRQRDGAVVVSIPAGEFLMGNAKTERQPLEHRVFVSDFLIDKTEVTWGQYKRFAEASGTPLPSQEPYWGIHDDHPVVFVAWDEAKAYCEWVGGRLPTEAEWEKASRGADGRMYPWGDEPVDPQRAVYQRAWGTPATDRVGAHPSGASPYGLMDMGGNVWEWCSDWYADGYYASSHPKDPTGPSIGIARVVRGGSWDSRPSVLSSSCRSWGHSGYREGDFGFRCAMNAPR